MSPIDLGPIDAIIDQLQAVVAEAERDGSRVGYFAALYTRITVAVRRAIDAGRFDDGAAVVRMDVAFARRYLVAREQYRRHDAAISPPWAVAFGATERSGLSIVQHLVLGVNAHISFDLGLATFECFGAQALETARPDFERVNEVLATEVAEVMKEIGKVSPILGFFERLNGSLSTWLIDFALLEARAFAWNFAEMLAGAEDAARPGIIDRKGHEVASICSAIIGGPIRGAAFALIAALEVRDVSRAIRILDRGLALGSPGGPGGTSGVSATPAGPRSA
jgi:Family of unknown function (DUF5995)